MKFAQFVKEMAEEFGPMVAFTAQTFAGAMGVVLLDKPFWVFPLIPLCLGNFLRILWKVEKRERRKWDRECEERGGE